MYSYTLVSCFFICENCDYNITVSKPVSINTKIASPIKDDYVLIKLILVVLMAVTGIHVFVHT